MKNEIFKRKFKIDIFKSPLINNYSNNSDFYLSMKTFDTVQKSSFFATRTPHPIELATKLYNFQLAFDNSISVKWSLFSGPSSLLTCFHGSTYIFFKLKINSLFLQQSNLIFAHILVERTLLNNDTWLSFGLNNCSNTEQVVYKSEQFFSFCFWANKTYEFNGQHKNVDQSIWFYEYKTKYFI